MSDFLDKNSLLFWKIFLKTTRKITHCAQDKFFRIIYVKIENSLRKIYLRTGVAYDVSIAQVDHRKAVNLYRIQHPWNLRNPSVRGPVIDLHIYCSYQLGMIEISDNMISPGSSIYSYFINGPSEKE